MLWLVRMEPLKPKSLRERYADALPAYLMALDDGSGEMSPRTVHPTPKEKMLAAKAMALKSDQKPSDSQGA